MLFEFGSTHTFIANAFVDMIDMGLDDLFHHQSVCEGYHQCVLLIDFIVMSMREFDVIFGMD